MATKSDKAVKISQKHLLGIQDLSISDVNYILSEAKQFIKLNRSKNKKLDTLRGKTQINLFFEPSTRTQSSFELAGKRLGADVMTMNIINSALRKGETLMDTAMTLNAMHPDIIVIRHQDSGACNLLSQKVNCAVINAGDGRREHPCKSYRGGTTPVPNRALSGRLLCRPGRRRHAPCQSGRSQSGGPGLRSWLARRRVAGNPFGRKPRHRAQQY